MVIPPMLALKINTVCFFFFFSRLIIHNLIYREPSGAPIKVEDVRWKLSLSTKSVFTSMDRNAADTGWDSIIRGTNQSRRREMEIVVVDEVGVYQYRQKCS